MSDDQSAVQTEDIDLDEAGAESVVGGASRHHHKPTMTVAQAEKAGYTAVECERDGMLMRNAAGKEFVARY